MTASASASECRISSTKTVISVELFGQLALAGKLSPFRFQGRQVFERYLAAIEAWPSIPALSAADASLFIYSNDLPLGARGHRLGQDIFQKLGRFASWYRGLRPRVKMAKAANSSTRAAGFRNGIASAKIGHQGAASEMFGRVRVDLATAGLLLGASHK